MVSSGSCSKAVGIAGTKLSVLSQRLSASLGTGLKAPPSPSPCSRHQSRKEFGSKPRCFSTAAWRQDSPFILVSKSHKKQKWSPEDQADCWSWREWAAPCQGRGSSPRTTRLSLAQPAASRRWTRLLWVLLKMSRVYIVTIITFALKTSRTSMQMLRLIVLFLNRNPNFLSSSLVWRSLP